MYTSSYNESFLPDTSQNHQLLQFFILQESCLFMPQPSTWRWCSLYHKYQSIPIKTIKLSVQIETGLRYTTAVHSNRNQASLYPHCPYKDISINQTNLFFKRYLFSILATSPADLRTPRNTQELGNATLEEGDCEWTVPDHMQEKSSWLLPPPPLHSC
jgi:hypothetical protein